MKEIRTEIEISAQAQKVWDILIDFNRYQEWNPFIQRVSGKAAVGDQIKIWLRTPGGRERSYEPSIVKIDPGQELRWLGKSFFLDGEHVFVVEAMSPEKTRFIQFEIFKGFLARFFGESTEKDIAAGFEQMNQAIKRRAESVTI